MRSAVKDETTPLLPSAYWGILLEVSKDRLTGPNVALGCPVSIVSKLRSEQIATILHDVGILVNHGYSKSTSNRFQTQELPAGT